MKFFKRYFEPFAVIPVNQVAGKGKHEKPYH
jgi:hypothetical protein